MGQGKIQFYPLKPEIFGIAFDNVSTSNLISAAIRKPETGQGVRLVVTANIDHIVRLRKDAGLRSAYKNAWVRTIDGLPVMLYAKARGVQESRRITGSDLLPLLLEKLDPNIHKPYFVVASATIETRLSNWMLGKGFAKGDFGIAVPPFGFEHDQTYSDDLARKMRSIQVSHIIFGVGCPKSEVWIDSHRHKLGDCYAFAVGAAVSFFVGTQVRAPNVVRKIGMEWLWRVGSEPRRLSKRYFLQSWPFIRAIAEDLANNRTA